MQLEFEGVTFLVEKVAMNKVEFKALPDVPQGEVWKTKDGSLFSFVEFMPGSADSFRQIVFRFCDQEGKKLNKPNEL